MRRLFHGVVSLAVLAGQPAVAQGHPDRAATPAASVQLDFAAAIPNIAGKSLKTVLVNYAPGGSSPAHSHAKSAFILAYVLEGSVMSAVDGAPPRAFKAGEWWTENPGDHHREALGWAQALTCLPQTKAPDADYERLRASFTEAKQVRGAQREEAGRWCSRRRRAPTREVPALVRAG